MEYTERLFAYVEREAPAVWQQMLALTRLHPLASVQRLFHQHLSHVPDLRVFNAHPERLPEFLLQFCRAVQRNLLTPGDSYGTLLTCRTTHLYTQDTLDKRHLKSPGGGGPSVDLQNDLHFELTLYTTLHQILELTNRRRYTTLFVKDTTLAELWQLSPGDTAYLDPVTHQATGPDRQPVCVNLKAFLVTESFVPGIWKVLMRAEHKAYALRHLRPERLVAYTDLKSVYEKCGLVCFAFNLHRVVQLQFFKHAGVESRHERDILNILRYLYYSGVMLSINRNGLKKNSNRSGLDRCCFEAIKQILVSESLQAHRYEVQSLIEQIYFGQQFAAGTGYPFAVLPQQPLEKQQRATQK